jgi:hypothetical protein
MLDAALRYRTAITKLTEDRVNDVRDFELTDDEWIVLEQLRDVLKARNICDYY